MRVVALYEFNAEPGSAELALTPGEYLTGNPLDCLLTYCLAY